jgi:tripartite-type tricarboxylate transporter receptor subunit TctC
VKLPRRIFLHLAAGAAALPAVSRRAGAQTYPTRPVNIIVGFPAGSGVDATTRLFGQWLSERLGQPFTVENRLGDGTNAAAEAVVRAPADGTTLLLATVANAINATLYEKLNFNFVRDITPVAGITRITIVMVVHPSFPAKTVPEFIAYAKANPGKVILASPFVGTPTHLAGSLFKMMTGVDLPQVIYPGGDVPALIDLLGGKVQVQFSGPGAAMEYIRSGKLRALAVTTTTRFQALPDVPTMGEFVPDYEVSSWFGLGAPRNTPIEIVDRLNRAINAGLADPKTRARLDELGNVPMSMTPAEFGKFVADETEKWAKVVKLSGIKPQ